jgi:hypothetical protein
VERCFQNSYKNHLKNLSSSQQNNLIQAILGHQKAVTNGAKVMETTKKKRNEDNCDVKQSI